MSLYPSIVTRTLWWDLLKSCGFVAISLVSLQMVFKMLGESGNLKRDYDFADSIYFSLLMAGPGSLVFILPIIMLLATLLVLGRMSDNSELVVLQASGVSKFGIFRRLLPVSLTLCIAIMLLEDIAFLPLRNYAIDWRDEQRGFPPDTSGSLAIKQGNLFIITEEINATGQMQSVYAFEFDDDFELIAQAVAKVGQASDNRIVLEQPLISSYGKLPEGQTSKLIQRQHSLTKPSTKRGNQLVLKTDHSLNFLKWLSLSKLTDTARLSFSQLFKFARFQQQISPHNNQFLQVFYNKLMLPFNILAFILLVMPFIFGSTRNMNTSTKVIIAVLIGLVFVNFQQLTLPIHVVFGLPPLLVATIPGLLTLGIAWALSVLQR